jgi:hypothetical protein
VDDFTANLALGSGVTVAAMTTHGHAATRTTSTVAVTTTMAAEGAATARVVHGGVELQLHIYLVLESACLEGDEMREHVIEGDRLAFRHHGGDKGIILDRETYKQISVHLFISKWSIGDGELVGEPRNLAEEVGNRKIVLPGCCEFDTNLHYVRLCGRGKFRSEGVPNLLGRLGDDDVPKNFLGHRREEATEQLVVLIAPMLILWIGYLLDAGGRGRDDYLGRHRVGAIEEPHRL